MFRIIIIIAVGIIAAILMSMLMKRIFKSVDKISQPKTKKSELIACATCGSYTPISNAIKVDGKYFCSQSCADKY